MKTLVSTLAACCLLFIFSLDAQSYYQNVHSRSNHYQNGKDVTAVDDDLTLIAQTQWYGYDVHNGQWDWFDGIQLCKTDQDGALLWDKLFTVRNASPFGNSINLKSDGGYLIAGSLEYDPMPQIMEFPFLLTTDAQGQTQLNSTVHHSPNFKGPSNPMTLISSALAYAEENINNNIITIGNASYMDQYQNTKRYVPVMEISSAGNIVKEAVLEFDKDAEGVSLKSLADGGYIALVYLSGYPDHPNSTVILRLDADLDPVWTKEISLDQLDTEPVDLLLTEDDHLVVAGNINDVHNRIYLLRMTLNGQLDWHYEIDFAENTTNLWVKGINNGMEDQILISGNVESTSLFSGTQYDIFSILCQSTGVPAYGMLYGKKDRFEYTWGSAVFNNGDQAVVGEVDVQNALIIKATPNGDSGCDFNHFYPDSKELELSVSNIEYATYHSPYYDLIVLESTQVNYTPDITNCPWLYVEDLKGDETGSTLKKDNLTEIHSEAMPNPSRGSFQLTLPERFDRDRPVTARLLNIQGQLIRTFTWQGLRQEVQVGDVEKGMYVMQMQQGELVDQVRIVIQ